jgi:hypothetical protein
MMMTCKKIYKTIQENDELWFIYYSKRYQTKNSKYSDNFSKWRELFFYAMKSLIKTNLESLKHKYLHKYTKNNYEAKKDPYFLANNLYRNMKPSYFLELDSKHYKVKHVYSNKILSHINFFVNFDQEFLQMNKINTIKLNVTEKNLGIFNKCIGTYEIKKRKFTEYNENTSKICNIFYDSEILISTFEKNLIFFFNISVPICKICESLFDFTKGIHSTNLNYFDDLDSKFGLYDYSLLINIKSWNSIFYSVNVNTMDFKSDENLVYYQYTGKSKIILIFRRI